MSKELVISAASHERRVAILEEGQLVEIYIEREKEFALVGSIYKGRVTRVLPGMQSAFVDIGLDGDAFACSRHFVGFAFVFCKVDHNLPTASCEILGGRGADARRAAGNQRDFHTVAIAVEGEPTAPGRRSGGAVRRKRLRWFSRSQRASSER